MRKLFLLGFLVLALVWMPGMAGAYTLTLDIATDGVSSPTNPEVPGYTNGKWGDSTLGTPAEVTWSIATTAQSLDNADAGYWWHDLEFMAGSGEDVSDYVAEIARAFDTWETVCGITFTQVNETADVPWNTDPGSETVGQMRLGGGPITLFPEIGPNAIASTQPPPKDPVLPNPAWDGHGDIYYNDALDFGIGTYPDLGGGGGSNEWFDIYTVTLHEIGHAMGLWHSELPFVIMSGYGYDNYAGNPDNEGTLTADDIAGAVALYGLPNGNGTLPVPEPSTILLMGLGLLGMGMLGRKKIMR